MTERQQMRGPRIITALDFDNVDECLRLARQLDPSVCRVKVGKELFTRGGPAVVEQLQSLGFEVFLDLKFHDIPATVAGALKAAAELGVWMVNVHIAGGPRMLDAAVAALAAYRQAPLLIGVTVLTSMNAEELKGLGVSRPLPDHVAHLAKVAQQHGLHGVVASAREASDLKDQLGQDFLLVTPGIRPAGAPADDQSRIMTPAEAVAAGSDYLVIGRSITGASDPAAICKAIAQSIGS